MVNLIPKSVENIWEIWDVRGVILFSFFLQVFLVFCAPLRKRSDRMLVGWCIWSAYLLADWAANYGVGLITNNCSCANNINNSSSKDDLMAFWAPFLLVHFGGPDTITAFALEDNQLWLRQIPAFFFQIGASAYVFILTLPENTLWIPTVLIFIAGIIKYTERARALYLASMNFVPGGSATSSVMRSDEVLSFERKNESDEELAVVKFAHSLFYLNENWDFVSAESSSIMSNATKVLRTIEIQLELIYKKSYTKASVLHHKVGFLLRFVAFSSIVIALGVFTSVKKNTRAKFDEIDVIITNTLLYGAVCLDAISFLNLVFSDWIIARWFSLKCCIKDSDLLKFYEANVVKHVLSLRRQRWSKEPYTKFQALSTTLLFRKWCGSISGHNLIRYCLDQVRSKNQGLKGALCKVADCVGARELLEMSIYKSNSAFLLELWEFIFHEMAKIVTTSEIRTLEIDGLERVNERVCKLRQKIIFDYALERVELNEESRSRFLSVNFFSGQETRPFADVLITWHVATDLCYADEHDAFEGDDERHFSKLLSDYMLYLLIMQPNMLSKVTDRNEARYTFIQTCDRATEFFRSHEECFNHHKEEKKEMVACRCLLSMPRDFAFSSGQAHSVLSEALELAKGLQELQDKKWKIIGIAWVEMLAVAASNSEVTSHAEQISKGGGLVTLVWAFVKMFPYQLFNSS